MKRLREFLVEYIDRGHKFILVAGGGSTARNYQKAADAIITIDTEDIDWLGIHSTRLNAHLLRTIFYDIAYPTVLDSPEKLITKNDLHAHSLFVASGWRPGWSTDYIAFRLAHRFNSRNVIIATKISYVYDKDIQIHKNAKPFLNMSWNQYMKLLPQGEWMPGMKIPVDPIATKFAKKNNISCVVLRGTNLLNMRNYIDGKKFQGTIIS